MTDQKPNYTPQFNKINFNGGKCCCNDYFNCHDCRDDRQFNKAHDTAIRNATLKKLLEDVCKECPVKEECMPLGDNCAESCDGCLVQSVVMQSLRTKEQP